MKLEPIKGESSMARVARAAELHGEKLEILEMDQSTRTAEDAAAACGCAVGQIVKSLIFERSDNEELVLVLVSGQNQADQTRLADHFGTKLKRADPKKVRDLTGFAIGGVAPIGHLCDLAVVIDEDLAMRDEIWAAAGNPKAVFKTSAPLLKKMTDGKMIKLA